MNKTKIQQFTDLIAWQEARNLVLYIYSCSKKFPKEELFGLTSQIRRAAISVTSNIAEGFGRWSPKDKVRFYQQAHGSLTEAKSQLYLAKDLHFIESDEFEIVLKQMNTAHALLQGLMTSTRKNIIF